MTKIFELLQCSKYPKWRWKFSVSEISKWLIHGPLKKKNNNNHKFYLVHLFLLHVTKQEASQLFQKLLLIINFTSLNQQISLAYVNCKCAGKIIMWYLSQFAMMQYDVWDRYSCSNFRNSKQPTYFMWSFCRNFGYNSKHTGFWIITTWNKEVLLNIFTCMEGKAWVMTNENYIQEYKCRFCR